MTERANRGVFVGILVIAFAAIWIMSCFTPLEADDYSYLHNFATGERLRFLGELIPSLRIHYLIHSGRVVTNGLAQVMLLLGKTVFNLANGAMFVAFLLGFYGLVSGGKKYDWPLLLAVLSAVFLFAPVFGVAVLWLDGSCNYLWGMTMILHALRPFKQAVLIRGGGQKRPWVQGLYGLLALLAGNVIDNMSLGMICMMALSILWLCWQKQRVPAYFWGMLGMACLGYLVLVGSPAMTVAKSGLGGYLSRFSLCVGMALDQWPLLLTYAVLFFLARGSPNLRERLWLSLGLAACAMLCNLGMILADRYPQRAAFGWVVMLLAACGILIPSLEQVLAGRLWHGLVAGLALTAVLTFLWAMPLNYERYRMAEARVAEALAQRDAGVTEVVVFGIRSRSKYDIFRDGVTLSGDSNWRPNLGFAKYYGLDSVRLSEEIY
ncbi:MAG: DUF6056 family protein [Clostridia bacterium]|nr:DUF6056 family protein [Clostridia bacterium]